MFGLGPQEIILICIVILVLFGAKKIPDLMSGLGKGMREFKKASRDIESEINNATTDEKKTS
ncbi:MAG TPA: twin-arginine translocase TatA/TatE family subunit [Ignavibacteria bacterium]|nr:twin-arginine translocase TatA/TatE family subunit [Ignavibacteria bacterium]HAX47372.1 twin-arginine translocase TatA/TatE family subunit [Bacteroidota bacterium]HRE12038.1 twin-arginine translocase TatA/TatE family subunit [Ignavibacteria bacterium]HRF64742.1 twin-arginine translocase TatA/TatE family subunit [Ignavibacteria bacterium]HRJ04299.1 twin-arginine translocase TatA/TatE family subunit [Ignavibacteria bacterium]